MASSLFSLGSRAFSKALLTLRRILVGRNPSFRSSPALVGKPIPLVHWWGSTPSWSTRLNRPVRNGTTYAAKLLSNQAGMSSWPWTLRLLIPASSSRTASTEESFSPDSRGFRQLRASFRLLVRASTQSLSRALPWRPSEESEGLECGFEWSSPAPARPRCYPLRRRQTSS